jgi:hypothetical protein
MNNPKFRFGRLQFSLGGLLLVVGLFALSFGLLRKACLTEDDTGFIWFGAGLYVFAATIGAAIDRLSGSGRSGILGALIPIPLVLLVLLYLFLLGNALVNMLW